VSILVRSLTTLTTEAAGELDVLALDGDTLGVDGAEVGVLEEPDEVGLGGLLQRGDGGALEAEVGLEVLRDLPHQALEGELADEQLRALLVIADLPERDGVGNNWKLFSTNCQVIRFARRLSSAFDCLVTFLFAHFQP
jgi:hypothetical protein